MAKGFFITGTDTGVGKTIISGAVIKLIISFGLKACGMKPIESGCICSEGTLFPPDGMFLKKIACMEEPLTVVTPLCFKNPLAPMSASEIEKTEFSLSDIKKAFQKLSRRYEAVVVEGVGGLLVPIQSSYYVIDLVQELSLPLIVVARPGLGTINHTMLTVKYALKEGLKVAGIIINYSRPPEKSLAEKTNPGLLSRISPVPVIGIFPHLKNTGKNIIEKSALKTLNKEVIKEYLF